MTQNSTQKMKRTAFSILFMKTKDLATVNKAEKKHKLLVSESNIIFTPMQSEKTLVVQDFYYKR